MRASGCLSQANPQAATTSKPATAPPSAPTAAQAPASRFRPSQPQQAGRYYGLVWGVDSLSVKLVESGELVRFSYFVLDPSKAKTLNEKKLQPFLEDPKANVKLVVPQLEQVGLLRQSSPQEAGKSYWIGFSNNGGLVKRGDHVDVVIGSFRAEGLIVQ